MVAVESIVGGRRRSICGVCAYTSRHEWAARSTGTWSRDAAHVACTRTHLQSISTVKFLYMRWTC